MTIPAPGPAKPGITNRSCLLWIVGFVVVVIGGLMIGNALSKPDDPNDEAKVTVEKGSIGDTDWKVTAERDIDGAACTFLYENGGDDPLTGACSLTPQDATFGDRTVVFGRAASSKDEVTVSLSNGDSVTIPTQAAGDIEGRFYVKVVDGDVDAAGFATGS